MSARSVVSLSMSYRTVSSRRDAIELSNLLQDPTRYNPVVVVSSAKKGTLVNLEELANRLGNEVDVYVLATSGVAFDFDDVMPDETSVYGGAIRSYPPGTQWVADQRKSTFRNAYSEAEEKRLIGLIVSDVADMALPVAVPVKKRSAAAGPVKPAAKKVHTGTVAMLVDPDRAIIKLTNGEMARIDTSVLAPGISPRHLIYPGQRVEGTVTDGMLDISAMVNTPATAVDHVAAGGVYPALVLNEKKVALFPGLDVRLQSDHAPETVIAVVVEQVGRADGKEWRLFEASRDAEVLESLPFIKSADPWLKAPVTTPPAAVVEPQDEPVIESEAEPAPPAVPAAALDLAAAVRFIQDAFHDMEQSNSRLTEQLHEERARTATQAPSAPVPTPSAGGAELERVRQQLALETRARIEALESAYRAGQDLDQYAADLARVTRENERLREDIRVERERATRARQLNREIDATESGQLFADPAEQFRHEVYLEWANRIPAASKASMPLPEYGFGDNFIDCVETIQGIDRSKIIAVAVEVLTGIADSLPGREMHRLRNGVKGDSGYRDHPEHGTAWRVSLQVKTASARRLHFWRGTDGKITFATVGVHDEMGI